MKKSLLAILLFAGSAILFNPQLARSQSNEPILTPSGKKARQIEAILKSGDSSALDQLKPFLTDEDWYVRGEAGRALGLLGDKSAMQELKPLLQDKNWFVKVAAIEALSNLGDLSIASSLVEFLQSNDIFTQAHAAEALGKMNYAPAIDPLI